MQSATINQDSKEKDLQVKKSPKNREVDLKNMSNISIQLKQNVSNNDNPQTKLDILKNDSQSQFLVLNQQMTRKLQKIDEDKRLKQQTIKSIRTSKIVIKNGTKLKLASNKSLDNIQTTTDNLKGQKRSLETERRHQKQIKKQFIHKLKEWERQKQQIGIKKKEINERKLQNKKQMEARKKQEEEDQKQFQKLQKKKQLQQKINQIQQRRRKREDSLKNAVLKRSYNGVPKYLEYQKKFNAKEDQKAILDLKLIKNKKDKMMMDAQQLRAHEKAYIQRIKERLNINFHKKQNDQSVLRKTKSDFNLYLKKSEDLKQAELQKIIRRKKFQQKINKIPIKIDQQKKKEVLISIDKAKHPQKYHMLSQKALNDRQIYEQFRDFDIEIDRKELGKNYLNQLKNAPKRLERKTQSQSEILTKRIVSNEKLPKIIKNQQLKREPLKQVKSQGQTVKSYEQSLMKAKQKDNKYMGALKQKLSLIS